MWPFPQKKKKNGITASSVDVTDGFVTIDVRGLTCPGYLLAINKAVSTLPKKSKVKLLITYPPCGEDVKAWCKEKDIKYIRLSSKDETWVIEIET